MKATVSTFILAAEYLQNTYQNKYCRKNIIKLPVD